MVVTFSFGENVKNKFSLWISSAILKVRREGQGAPGKKRCVLFPKLVFLYVDEYHGEGKEYGLQDDNNEYLKWMHKAAEGGYRSAMFSLGLYYEKINRNKAIYWYSKDLDTYYARNSKIDETDLSYKHLVEMGVDYSPQSNRPKNFNEDFNYNDNHINSPNSNNANINNNSPKEDCTASSSATTAPSNVSKNVAPQKRTVRTNVPVRTNRTNKTRVKVRR